MRKFCKRYGNFRLEKYTIWNVTTKQKKIWKRGEEYAASWLVERGWVILEKNRRYPWGEIDIVATDPKDILVFVEVKTVRPGMIKAEDQMTAAKLTKLRRVAEGYANAHPNLVDDRWGWRIDVLALTVCGDGYEVRHYENV